MASSISQPNAQDSAKAFQNNFANVEIEISKHLDAENEPEVPRRQQSMFFFKVTLEEVQVVISNLDNKSSSGEDFVNKLLLKMPAPVQLEYITFLINLSFNRDKFPQLHKKAKVFSFAQLGFRIR